MSDSKMREEFETAVALEAGEPVLAVYLSRRNDTYSTSTLHFAWWAWQASRQSLVIELPGVNGTEYDPLDNADYRDACLQAIESAGVKCEVKS